MRKSHEALDPGSTEGVWQQLFYYWPEIYAQTKLNDPEHYCGRETNLHCTTPWVIFAAHLSIQVAEFIPLEQIYDA